MFQFHTAKFRTMIVDGEPMFVARDKGEVLGYVWIEYGSSTYPLN